MVKLKIKNLDNNTSFDVLFNPTDYTIEDGSKWQEQQGNRRKPELQYTGGDRKRLTMELFLDTYEVNEDVRKYTSEFAKLLLVTIDDSNNGKRPPIVEVIWGTSSVPNSEFPFKGVLETLKQQYTLFNSEGVPVRAKLNVTFKEYSLPKEEMQREPRRRSFPEQTYIVKAGDTLSGIAATLLQDPLKWRRIATRNHIHNPRILKPGQRLIIPAVE